MLHADRELQNYYRDFSEARDMEALDHREDPEEDRPDRREDPAEDHQEEGRREDRREDLHFVHAAEGR